MSDGLTDFRRTCLEVTQSLETNRKRRADAEAELAAARDELRALLARGSALGFGMAQMARDAGVSRDTAHRLLRDTDIPSWEGRHRLAKQAGIPPGPPRGEWFAAQGWGR